MTHHAATALFFTFGARSLYQSVFAWEGGGEELAEVEKELGEGKESSKQKGNAKKRALGIFSPVLAEVFTLTFLAEWGDRSQIATIGLAASSNVVGVTLGGCLGHAVCTGAAVAGGKGMATMISERAVAVRARCDAAQPERALLRASDSMTLPDLRRGALPGLWRALAADGAGGVKAAAVSLHALVASFCPVR